MPCRLRSLHIGSATSTWPSSAACAGGGAARNTFWDNQSFRNYADYTATDAFREGLRKLTELGRRRRCAIMCAEAVWWRCHRRIIADYLLAAGETVCHILGPNHVEPAKLTPAAKQQPDGTLIYPRPA
jgi:uncharacterized protein (DUF488 family)